MLGPPHDASRPLRVTEMGLLCQYRSVDSMLLPKRPSPCDSTEQKEIHRT